MAACAQCGSDLPDAARFCPSCGASIETRPPPVDERKLAALARFEEMRLEWHAEQTQQLLTA